MLFGSYLVFPFLGYLLYKYFTQKNKNWKNYFWYWVFILGSLLFIYARFIESNMIVVKHAQIQTGFEWRFVLVADMHLWIYKDKEYLEKIVEKINKQDNIDWVLIPWDFTLVVNNDVDFETLFSPLKNLKYPAFATLGNHDTMNPGPDISEKLIQALEKNNVTMLENKKSFLKEKNIHILGLWDNWAENDRVEIIDEYSSEDNLVVLAHNPDTTLRYSNTIADLTVSGHTHGWQIRVPFIWKKVIPVKWDFVDGFYDRNGVKLYITSGVWEVGLPLRFRIPPEIVVIDLVK